MRLGTYYRKKLLENLNIKTSENDVVLDVGCFDGYWLSTQSAKEKHAIDIDINPLYDSIRYQKGDATQLPYPDSYFDKVFAFDVIEHIEIGAEKKFVAELIRVTKSGGKIILTTPSKDIRVFPGFLTNWISKKWGHYKCNGYTLHELHDFIDTKGTEVQSIQLSCRGYLNNYIILRLIWKFNKNLIRNIVDKLAVTDSIVEGTDGYTLLTITK